ncbi:hypothetical protein WSM22_04130 [Cytophagales bacterium WSM2-2]|nr:hypothetical protein WSM22_04130 [Cytophagales bacterium WSM2-2]
MLRRLSSADSDLILQVADLYCDQWSIPKEKTIARLNNHPNDDVLFQLVNVKDGKVVVTGGLYNNVGLLNEHPRFNIYKSWVAQIVTEKKLRGHGLGEQMLREIEMNACKDGLTHLHLFTFTAESLYVRNGWTVLERVTYKGHHNTAVMYKNLIAG